MTDRAPPPNWSIQFLKTTAGIIVLSPLVGVLLFLLWGQATGSAEEPQEIALHGAKVMGLIGGFAAPLISLGLVAREINRRASRGRPTSMKESDED